MSYRILIDFLENTINYKKLKQSRKRRKLSVREVAEQTGIPISTLQRYEDGTTKRVPSEAVIKLSKLYGTDYRSYYGWSAFPLLNNTSGILMCILYNIPLEKIYNGVVLKKLTTLLGIEKVYNSLLQNKKNEQKILLDLLTEKEKKDYIRYKRFCTAYMDTDNILGEEEKKENENLLFLSFMLHIIKLEGNKETSKIDLNQIETLNSDEIKNS